MENNMEDTSSTSLKGHFLIAMPSLLDPNFSKSVVCISEDTAEGSMGLVINRCHSSISGKDVFEELKLESIPESEAIPVYIGGPVHIGELFVFHGPPFGWESCFEISPLLAMSNSMDILEEISMGKGPESYMITLGCSGWGGGQLAMELRQNVWLTCPIDEGIIFNTPVEDRWEKALKTMGINPDLLVDSAGHA